MSKQHISFISVLLSLRTALAVMPSLEPAFSVAQVEKGAPQLAWTRNADGSESTVLQEKDAGIDLAGVRLTRSIAGDDLRRVVSYTLENVTDGLRYASLGWRTSFEIRDANDRNWFPTTDNVLDLNIFESLWGYYTKPGAWQFSLVEPWFAAYNPGYQVGYGFIFDMNTLSAAYGSDDMKTRGVLFDGGMLPAGKKIMFQTIIRDLRGLPSLATVNDSFAAGFWGKAESPALFVQSFADAELTGTFVHRDVRGRTLGSAEVSASVKVGVATSVCVVNGRKPDTQSVLAATVNGVSFEFFRENGYRMTALPMVPAAWPYHRPMPAKQLGETASYRPEVKDKALLLFGFYANFFRFDKVFPELKMTVLSATPQGITRVPPATTIGEYKYIFLGDVNEESLRPMMTRLAAYVANGGTLVVGGGPFAYGCGGYEGTFLESMLPVKTHRFDCRPACAHDKNGRTAVAFSRGDAKLFWIQKDEVKAGASVLLKTKLGDPLLVRGAYGEGRVFAFLGTPLGDEVRDAKAFWNGNESYLELMRELLR